MPYTTKSFIKNIFQKFVLTLIFSSALTVFAFIALSVHRIYTQEIDLQKLLLDNQNHVTKAFFSPDDQVKSILIKLIEHEQKSIKIAIYTFTEKEIANALIDAAKRDIKVEIVTDRSYGAERYSKIPQLANHHIPIWVYRTLDTEKISSIMHHKFCIFEQNVADKTLVWTGSYNFTVRASTINQENVVILDQPEIVESFNTQFKKLKEERGLQISGTPGITYALPDNSEVSLVTLLRKWWRILTTA